MARVAYKIAVYDSERGWGKKLDDYIVCPSAEEGLKFQKDFNSKNIDDVTPDFYSICEGDPTPIEVTDEQWDNIEKHGNQWFKNLDNPLIKSNIKKCIISRYDTTITKPPYLTIPIDKVEVREPENDEGGVELSERLIAACRSRGYVFKFYTMNNKGEEDYEIVVH